MKVAVIGCGNMGSALAKHLAKGYQVTICSRHSEKGEKMAKEIGAVWEPSPSKAAEGASWVILAIKPKDLGSLELKLSEKQNLASILVGTSLEMLRKKFPKPLIFRMMPNTALKVGKGMMGIVEEEKLSKEKKKEVELLFSGLGRLFWMPENKMGAFEALAGSSPAFGLLMMEAMMEAGVFLGFSWTESRDIVTSVFEGCTALLQEFSSLHPSQLKLEITSPGGTTIEGIRALEKGSLRSCIFDALEATYRKGLRVSHE